MFRMLRELDDNPFLDAKVNTTNDDYPIVLSINREEIMLSAAEANTIQHLLNSCLQEIERKFDNGE